MASTFDLMLDFPKGSSGELISVDPYWIVAIFRFAWPTTYNRQLKASASKLYDESVSLRGPPLVIVDDCTNLSVSSSKDSHLTTMNATLMPSARLSYMSEIMPGDWAACWMVHDRTKAIEVVQKLQKGSACNDFNDGLKFLGRVNSITQAASQTDDGVRTVRYSLTASGFNEFDATLFYDPHLAVRDDAIGLNFAKLGANLDDFVQQNGQGIAGTQAMLFFLDAMLGQGVPANLSRGNDDPRLKSTAGLSGEYGYIIPQEVAALLGKTRHAKSVFTAADIIEFVYGVQKYSSDPKGSEASLTSSSQSNRSADGIAAGVLFNPNGTMAGGSRRWTGIDPMGTFLPQTPQFTNVSVWSILEQYTNRMVNELYACLRVNPDGNVVPTLVFRQLPFSTAQSPTSVSIEGLGTVNFEVTHFLELPRWKVDPHLVRSYQVGRSDATRINFIHVYGDTGSTVGEGTSFPEQLVRFPPIRDDLDIARSGLRNYSSTVNCAPSDIVKGLGPAKWMALLSDFLMGQQLALTGSMELVGIQSPICPGDNVEFDGVVFHIESVAHQCAIDGAGRKRFATSLSLSHGVSASPTDNELGVYAFINTQDQSDVLPGVTSDSPIAASPFSQPSEAMPPEEDVMTNDSSKARGGK